MTKPLPGAINAVYLDGHASQVPLESLWGVIAEELKVNFRADQPPDINQFREALKNQKLVLILDELESGVRAISDPALKQRNMNFLQMLSEESNRAGSNVLLIASVYDGNLEPGLTLKRVARVELRFQDSADRRKVLFHRLFKKSPLVSSPEISAIVQSYLNTWRRFGIDIPPDYPDLLRQSFPFTPELLDVALVRIRASKGSFQGTRGALGFLAALVRSRCESTHLITMADASLLDAELRSWLADLDPSQNLLMCAESNLRELRSSPFADQIAAERVDVHLKVVGGARQLHLNRGVARSAGMRVSAAGRIGIVDDFQDALTGGDREAGHLRGNGVGPHAGDIDEADAGRLRVKVVR